MSRLVNTESQIWVELEAKSKEEEKRPASHGQKKRELLLVGHSMSVTSLSLSPTSYFLLSASLDCTVRLWSIHTASTLMIFKGHTFPVWEVKFAPLGYYFATASEDRTACVWRTSVGYPVRTLAGHLGGVETVEFHPNMHYVATGSNDKTIRMYCERILRGDRWEVETGQTMRVLTTTEGCIKALRFENNGRYLISGSKENGQVMR